MIKVLVSACLLGMNCRYNGVTKPNTEVLKLMNRMDVMLIPVCPEQMGGLPTPRTASEIVGDRVINKESVDVTDAYCRGAEEALKLAELYDCHHAILKERSPSCGSGEVYDGTFSGKLIHGDGITVRLLREKRIHVYGESQIPVFLSQM